MSDLLVCRVLLTPALSTQLSMGQWDSLLPQLRSAKLLGAFGGVLVREGLLRDLPNEVSRHITGALMTQGQQVRTAVYELNWLCKIFAMESQPVILLKGFAYIMMDLEAGRGRLLSDVDILVKRDVLGRIEEALNRYGWSHGPIDPYDDAYYRRWMHEIPPLANEERDITLDVHHTLLPPTTVPGLDSSLLFEDLRRVGEGVYVLSPVDMVLHSAAHLFFEGSFGSGLRDLWDLDRLVRELAASEERFWDALVERAAQLKIERSLYYALRYMKMFFDSPIPQVTRERVEAFGPGYPIRRIMDAIFVRGFTPRHPAVALPFSGVSDFFIYVRSHYLRMPLYLLLPHLARKAWMENKPSWGAASAGDAEIA